MRDYAKVVPTFWTGETGKAIRRKGPDAVIVALYLMTSPTSNMLGLYYQPILYMAHETGLGVERASEGLRQCIETGFCDYDQATEFVFVKHMAAFQVDKQLKASDNRCKGIQREYESLPENPFLDEFYVRYASAFHMTSQRGQVGAHEPLRSQEQEQEQEQEQDLSSLRSDSSASLTLTAPNPPADLKTTRAARVRQIADEAAAAYNAILAKPHGELSACAVLNKPRIRAVELSLPTARAMCLKLYGAERVTPQFWQDYFEEVSKDDFNSGRMPGGPGHENWKPDFEYLLREKVMAKLFDRAMTEAAA